MKETLKLSLTLAAVCLVSAFLISAVYVKTEPLIRIQEERELINGLKSVLPEFDNNPFKESASKNGYEIYIGKKNGKITGAAVKTKEMGYGGDITILTGVDSQRSIHNVKILDYSTETPGLGAKIADEEFIKELVFKGFVQRTAANTNWAVSKDGGDIVSVTGATISSRAAAKGVEDALLIINDFLNEKLSENQNAE